MNSSKEDVPFISISNSKSNSSKNQNSKSSSNIIPISMLQNYNSNSNSKKNSKNSSSNKMGKNISISEEEKSGIFTYIEKSFIQSSSFNQENKNISEDRKEVKTDKNHENETPKKYYDKTAVLKEKLKDKKKAIMKMDNIPGKNLMEYFGKMFVNVGTEDKTKKRVSSVENISYDNFRLKKNFLDINKSWNKNAYPIFNSHKKPIKIKNKYRKENQNVKDINKFNILIKKKSTSCVSKSAIKNFENIFKKNNINIDFENLLNKYMPNFPKKLNKKKEFKYQNISNNKNNNFIHNKLNTEKKINLENNKKTPKTDSYKRKLSSSYLKIKEISLKNLFHDYKPKQNEINKVGKNVRPDPNKKRLSAKIIPRTKPVISSMLKGQKNKQQNIFDKIMNKNNFIKINPIKKEQKDNKNNNKKINNYNEINSYFLKYREKHELQKPNEKGNQPNNKGINYKSKITKK
jgi:hypothetical protein